AAPLRSPRALHDALPILRVSAQMERARGATTVEDSMLVQLECAQGIGFAFDLNWKYLGEEDRFWFEVLASRGSGRLQPLRVIKRSEEHTSELQSLRHLVC